MFSDQKKRPSAFLSRNKRLINNEYPEIAAAFAQQKADNFIVDGEIVAKRKRAFRL